MRKHQRQQQKGILKKINKNASKSKKKTGHLDTGDIEVIDYNNDTPMHDLETIDFSNYTEMSDLIDLKEKSYSLF